jgi:hypothetical protein
MLPATPPIAAIVIEAGNLELTALTAPQSASAAACNLLAASVVETRCWNRQAPRNLG